MSPRHGIVLLAAAGGILFGAYFAWELSTPVAEIQAAGARTKNLSRMLEEHARQSLRRIELGIESAAGEIARAGDLSRTNLAALRPRLASHLLRDGLIRSFSIIDRDGAIALSTGEEPRASPKASETDYFVSHRERSGAGMVIGAATRSRVDGGWVVPVSRRLDAPDGSFLGVLLALVDPAPLQAYYDAIDTGAEGFVTLFQRAGWVVVRSPRDEELWGHNWIESPMFRVHLPASDAGTVCQVVADGVERIYSYRALKDYPVIVSVGLSLTDILQPWRARAWRDGALLLGIFAVLAGAVLALRAQLRRREVAEAELRRLSAIVELSSDLIMITRVDGQLVFMNAAARRAAGIGEGEDITRYASRQFQPPERWAFTLETARPEASKNGTWSGEARFRATDGRETDVSETLIAHCDGSGNPRYFTEVLRDISERKRIERALREAKQRLEIALEGSQVTVWESNARTGEVWLDAGWAAYLGTAPGETPTTAAELLDLVHPDDRQPVLDATVRTMKGEDEGYEVEHRIRAAGGDWKWILSRGRVIERDAAGRALRMSGSNADVTLRKRAEEQLVALNAELESRVAARTEALRVSESRLQHLLGATSAVIYSARPGGDYAVSFISGNVRDVLGYDPGEFTADPDFWPSHIHPDDRERVLAGLAKLETQPAHADEYRCSHKDGSWRWMRDETRVVRDAAGVAEELVGNWIDVTARRRMEIELRQANRMKAEFMANVTHELRTPLNAVIGFAELLKDEVPGPLNATQVRFAEDIVEGGRHLLRLVEAIMEMSRLDLAAAPPAREPVEIDAVIEERVAARRRAAEALGVSIGVEVAPDARRAELDPSALRRTFDALLDNAIRFNRAGGAVVVRARRHDGGLEIAVSDTGIGIAREDLAKVFLPLVQLDAGLTRRHGGVGLGLALARRLAELQGGAIDVESESGKGSTFTLRLPAWEGK